MSHLTGEDSRKKPVINLLSTKGGAFKIIAESMCSTDDNIFVPALRTVGNILTSEDSTLLINFIAECNVLVQLNHVISKRLSTSSNVVLKECLWAVSNMAAGDQQCIQLILQTEGLFENILQCCKVTNIDTRKEAVWIVCNMITGSNKGLLETMLPINDCAIVKIMADALVLQENRLVGNVLEAIAMLLKLDAQNNWEGTECLRYHFEIMNGFNHLDDLMQRPNYENY